MKRSMMKRTSIREIKLSLGRYLAILAIVALGVGFFAGLRITKPAMIQTAQQFLDQHEFYDYRLVSTLGWEKEDVDRIAALSGIESVQGGITKDFLSVNREGTEGVLIGLSITDQINTLEVAEGRLPENENECVIDARYTGLSVGDTLTISKDNDDDTREMFLYDEYVVVGKVKSPLYVNFERGTTSLLDGKVLGFVYFREVGLNTDYYTDIYLTYGTGMGIFSKEYDAFIDAREDEITQTAEQCLERRYNSIVGEAKEKLDDAQDEVEEHQAEIDDGQIKVEDAKEQLEDANGLLEDAKTQIEKATKQIKEGEEELQAAKEQLNAAIELGMIPVEQIAVQQAMLTATEDTLQAGREELSANENKYQEALTEYEDNLITLEEKEQELQEAQDKIDDANIELADAKAELEDAIDDMSDRKVYVLDRDMNIGYVSFQNDSSIVEGIANVFPIFFFLVAALVCMTTMTRMIEEQRTQIGVLKALGYHPSSIMNKYLFYSTSAAFLGSIMGFFGGCFLFPKVIWQAYGIMYDFSGSISYIFDPMLAILLLLAAFLCTGGATYLSSYYELASVPAQLIRPKSPKEGKRILLERIPFIWNHLRFMQKVSIRNTFRYKKRFFMMLLGISGCTALLVTGFGIKDSISDIVKLQYNEIEKYDASINLKESLSEEGITRLKEDTSSFVKDICLVISADIDVISENATKSITMIVPKQEEQFSDFIDFHSKTGEKIELPGVNEALLSDKAADKLGVKVGDQVTLQDPDFNQLEVTVTGIVENYIYNYVYIIPQTYEKLVGDKAEYITAFVQYQDGVEDEEATSLLLQVEEISSVSGNSLMAERFNSMLKSLNSIVLLVIICAAALAFIVLYNLTNINITERAREIATIKVLGFYQKEVSSYVLRENLVLTFFGSLLGLLLGKALHAFVILQIDISMVHFPILVKPISYLYSVALTFAFAVAVNVFMGRKLKAIDMAESLKAIE